MQTNLNIDGMRAVPGQVTEGTRAGVTEEVLLGFVAGGLPD